MKRHRLASAVIPLVTLAGMSAASAANPCDPLTHGAVGNGTFDNTSAIQSAVNACAARGGGIVPLSVVSPNTTATYVTGPFTLKSHVLLQINKNVILQGTNDHARYVPAFINWVYQPNEALISANGQTDVGIIGAGTIDGAGGQLQPGGGPSWWTLTSNFAADATNTGPANSFGIKYYTNSNLAAYYPNRPAGLDLTDVPSSNGMPRPWLIEFYLCNHVTINGVTLRNAPMWHQGLRFSNDISETGVTVNAPGTSPNTDGVDVVGSSQVSLANLNLAVGDDNIAIKSGLPLKSGFPMETGIPQIPTSNVMVTNITAGTGHGISMGSEAANGVNNVHIQNVRYTGTADGFRIKTGRDRGNRTTASQIFNITLQNLTMTNVALPLSINAYYPASAGPTEPPTDPAQPITATTPFVHDITINGLTATGATSQSIIEGLPESCIKNVALNNVSIKTTGKGLALRHMTGTFSNVIPTPTFVAQENVIVVAANGTPSITDTPPLAGQIACSAQPAS